MSTRREVNLAARLDLSPMTWTELPPSPSRGLTFPVSS